MEKGLMPILSCSLILGGLLSGCSPFGHNGTSLPLEGLGLGIAQTSYATLNRIDLSDIGGESYWSDAAYTVQFDFSRVISVPNHTISKINSDAGTIHLAEPLVPENSEKVVFDTTVIFYGTTGSSLGFREHKYRFTIPALSVSYY